MLSVQNQCRDQSDAVEGQAIRASGSVFRSDQALKADSSVQALKASEYRSVSVQFSIRVQVRSKPSSVQFQVQDQFRNVSVSRSPSQDKSVYIISKSEAVFQLTIL